MKNNKTIIAIIIAIAALLAVGLNSNLHSPLIPGLSKPLQSVNMGPDISVDGGGAACNFSGYVWACETCQVSPVKVPTPSFEGHPSSIEYIGPEGTSIDVESSSKELIIGLPPVAPEMPGCIDVPHQLEVRAMDGTGILKSDTLTITVRCCGV